MIFTPDSRRLVIGLDRQVCLYDAGDGPADRPRWEPMNIKSCTWRSVRTASGSRPMAITREDIRLWDATTGREVAVLRGHTFCPEALAFSPDGSRLASGGVYPDITVRLWDAATGRPIAAMRGHGNTIRCIAFDPDGRRTVSASPDQTAWLWDGVTGEPIAPLRDYSESLWNAIFSPDGKRVVTASADQTLRLWDANSGELDRRAARPQGGGPCRGVRRARLASGVASRPMARRASGT